jgi:hypothetical protein
VELNSFFPIYNGTFNADDPLVAPWWIPGWTAQDKISILADHESLVGLGFPTNLSFCRIVHHFFDPNSSGIPGFLTFMMSDGITVTDGDRTVTMPQRLAGVMNTPNYLAFNNWGSGVIYLGGGFLDATFFCTDQTVADSTIVTDLGQPFTYYVTEHWMGGRQYQITLPSSDAPGPVDLNSLIVAGSVSRYPFDPANPMGNFLIPIPPPSF